MVERDRHSAEIRDLHKQAVAAQEQADMRWKDNKVLHFASLISDFMDTRAGTGLSIGLILGLAVISHLAQPHEDSSNIEKFLLDYLPKISGVFGGIMLGQGLRPVTSMLEERVRTKTIRNIQNSGIRSPQEIVKALIPYEKLPPVPELTKWAQGDVTGTGEYRNDPRFSLVSSMSEALYEEEKKASKPKEARANARFKARKLFWQATILAQKIRGSTSYITEKLLDRGKDIVGGAGVGIGIAHIIEVLTQDRGAAVIGGLIDDIWVVSAILIRPHLPKLSKLFYPSTLSFKTRVVNENNQMHSPEQNFKRTNAKNNQPVAHRRQYHLPKLH